MASKGEVGIDIDVRKVPLREADMEPFEIMVSESQERMLCVIEPKDVEAVRAICDKWEVSSAAIGEVTGTRLMRIYSNAELVGEMPVEALVDDCPIYDLAPQKPSEPLYPPPTARLDGSASLADALLALVGSPNVASRRPLFEQYDAIVQSRTVRRPEQADAAVLALPNGTALAVSIDGNGRRVAADPYRGTLGVVLECASNLACVGAHPLGTTNNLNFGNPEKPHVAWQLTEAVRAIAEACTALEAPIVGGNVSLYNEGASGPIYPTPVIGMVGLLPDATRAGRLGFVEEGEAIALVGPFAPSLAASELSKLRGEPLPDGLPEVEIEAVRDAQAAVRGAVRDGLIDSAHDIAEGGIATALAECALAGSIGAAVEIEAGGDAWQACFGEAPGGFVCCGHATALAQLGERTKVTVIGKVGGDRLEIDLGSEKIELGLDQLRERHRALESVFQ
jgi:phosphoribosylformylglycinamidine synthase